MREKTRALLLPAAQLFHHCINLITIVEAKLLKRKIHTQMKSKTSNMREAPKAYRRNIKAKANEKSTTKHEARTQHRHRTQTSSMVCSLSALSLSPSNRKRTALSCSFFWAQYASASFLSVF